MVSQILLTSILLSNTGLAQVNSDYSMRFFGLVMDQLSEYRVSQAPGFGIGGELGRDLGRSFTLNVQIAYDAQTLTQDSVLSEWDWAYWENTYIEWLPGGDYEIINQTLSYASGDSIYSAEFLPTQTLNEIRLSLGLDYHTNWKGNIQQFAGLRTGLSIYDRGLKMQEHWTKRFDLDPDTTATDTFPGLNYDYKYVLTHFAPAKTGIRPFISPRLGLRWELSDKYDLELGWTALIYLKRLDTLEDFFNMSKKDFTAFPLESKQQLWIAFRFKY